MRKNHLNLPNKQEDDTYRTETYSVNRSKTIKNIY